MKATLGFFFFLLFLAGLALVVLQGREAARQNLPGGGAGLTGVSWQPSYIGAEPVPDESGIFVRFEVDGSINGNGGCNSFSGSLETTDAGIRPGPLAATRMACPEPIMRREMAFIEALQNMNTFEVSGDRLQLIGEDSVLLADLASHE